MQVNPMRRTMRKWQLAPMALLLFLILICTSCTVKEDQPAVFMNGADISFTPELEDHGVAYRDSAGAADIFTILGRHGFNSIRLKIWHTPKEGYNDYAHVAAMAKRIYEHKMTFMLDFHYSDWWADPQKQYKPKAWESLDFEGLKDSLYQYSKNVVSGLVKQGTPPHFVQIGNEIRPGMLWPDGRVDGDSDTPAQWDKLAGLLDAARMGVLEGVGDQSMVKIIVHFDNGANNKICRHFFDNLADRDVNFDIIGLSFYPRWHGTLDSLETNLADLSTRYDKDVMVVETAYPWTLGWNDNSGNIWGSEKDLHDGYEATPEGQARFFRELRRIVVNVPGGRGTGLYFWEPAWITAGKKGSHWENVGLFDFQGNVLPAMDVFTGLKD